ncbi:NFX1-type zinc finger-containing protein 1-like isoform X2 [Pelodiscus sinensis]|uniref:NFX1-type zinc finger-containing protein 1-like isoform X2 n=1 Tax=Pelodiscus sinensis TaxID=13735 RepID=UPI003F6BEA14
MSGQKRPWPAWPDRAWEPGSPKAARLSPEPGPCRRTDPGAILSDVERLCDHSPQQLLPFLLQHDHQLGQVMDSPGLSPAQVYTLLRALKAAVESAGDREQLQPVLALALQPAFALRSLLGFIAELETFQAQEGWISQAVMEDTVAALHHLLTACPEQTRTLLCHPVDLLFAAVQRLRSRGFQFTWIIQKRLHDTKRLADAAFPRHSEPPATPAWREDFHAIPVFPTPEELFVGAGPGLQRNRPVGPFESATAYLDTHFRLLREDFVRPLREGISAHFSLPSVFGGAGRPRGQLRLYRHVQLVKAGTSPAGAVYLARLPRGAAPASSKRLLSGSLTCLISDDCAQVLFGTVVGGSQQEPPRGAVWLDVRANHRDLLRRHLGRTSFTMVESPAFFESYQHVLEGLQEMDPARVPFRRYVVQCRTSILPPAHLGDHAAFDLSGLRPPQPPGDTAEGPGSAGDLRAVSPGDSHVWAPETFPHLDESQILAIRMALSREFVLIQGPPGTGKTFLGLQLVQILLRSRAEWGRDQSPLLVVCYTNHALDQFMEGILRFQPSGVVRIGGRSRSDKMATCSLRTLRRQQLPRLLGAAEKQQFGSVLKALRKRKKSITYCAAVLELLRRGILSDAELAAEMHDDHLEHSWVRGGVDPAPGRGSPAPGPVSARSAGLSTAGGALRHARLAQDRPGAAEAAPAPGQSQEGSSGHEWTRKCLEEGDIMTDEDLAHVRDVGELRLRDRWRLYRRWMLAYERALTEKLAEKMQEYETQAAQLAELTFQEDLRVLERSQVIGMTTTGAAKYRKLLQKVQPHTVIVEEAAEILEAHVLTSLTPACKHLILIGDHQQLRPKPADYTLEKKFFLGISLFERMINNQVPYVQLLYQHRMRPEISQLLVPLFYKRLEDHAAVADCEPIKGVGSSVFFVQHTAAESRSADSESYSNRFEASFLASLSRYLLHQGYAASQLTVLTPYHGQVLKIRGLMKSSGMGDVAVHAVDDFQGEENDIVLLSLVRSNREGRIGFLRDKNRLCVALSRARKGFYCVGNLAGIAAGSTSQLWKEILQLLQGKKLVGEGLTLVCQNHPETKTVVKENSDFSKVPDGGCALRCQTRLECGHPCPRRCHPHDRDHSLHVCQLPCPTLCELNHRCPRKCHEPCQPCSVAVEKVIPKCGHSQTVPCHLPADRWVCQEPCRQLLECEHPCRRSCGEPCSRSKCVEMVDVTLPCSHGTRTECYRQKTPLKCLETCKQELECGHHCGGSCFECVQGRLHAHCRNKCTRVLLCSHQCQEACFENCPPCKRKCPNTCRHSRCDKTCGEICFPCVQPCSWKCRHYRCTRPCSETCSRPRCDEPCQKSLTCSHPCAGLCGEPCPPKCRTCHRGELQEIFFGTEDEPDARFVLLEDCGHILEVQGLDRWMDGEPEGTEAQHVQLKLCPKCATPIQHNTRYNNVIKGIQQKIKDIKLRIQGSREELEAGKQQLLLRLSSDRDLVAWAGMEGRIASAASRQSLLDLENTLNFLASLSRLKQQAKTCTAARERNLRRQIEAVESWLSRNRHAFTAQQRRECRSEIKRLSYLGNIFERLSGYEGRSAEIGPGARALANEAVGLLQQQAPFTQRQEESLRWLLEEIEEQLPAAGLRLSEAERVMITEAMQFGRGHWYRCPQGHLYTIGECGRPMQQSSCPECGAAIGGQAHTLTAGNTADDHILAPATPEPRLQDSILALLSHPPGSASLCPSGPPPWAPSPHPQPDSLPGPHPQPDSVPPRAPGPHPQPDSPPGSHTQPDSPPPPVPSPHPDSPQTPSSHPQPDSPPPQAPSPFPDSPQVPSPHPQPDSPPPQAPSPFPDSPQVPSPHPQPDSPPPQAPSPFPDSPQVPSPHPQPDSPPPRVPGPHPQPDSPPPQTPSPFPDSPQAPSPQPQPQPDSPPPRVPGPHPQLDSPPPLAPGPHPDSLPSPQPQPQPDSPPPRAPRPPPQLVSPAFPPHSPPAPSGIDLAMLLPALGNRRPRTRVQARARQGPYFLRQPAARRGKRR